MNRPSLERVLGIPGACVLGLGSILGAGIYVALGLSAGLAGAQLPLAILLAGLVATLNGLSSARLASTWPVSGGTYEYGHRSGLPWAGNAAGWLFLAAKSASAATVALGLAAYVLDWLGIEASPVGRIGCALGFVAAATLTVFTGLRLSRGLTFGLVSVCVFGLLVFVTAMFLGPAYSEGSTLGVTTSPVDLVDLLKASALVFVAFTGYGRVATLGEEVIDPVRTIPRAVIVTLIVSMVLYLLVGQAALHAVGPERFASAARAGSAPLAVVAREVGEGRLEIILVAGALAGMAGVLLNLTLGLSRVVLAMSRRREFFPLLAAIHGPSRSPRAAVLFVSVLVGGLTCTGRPALTWSFSALCVLFYYALTNLCALRLPKAQRRLPALMPLAGLVACLTLALLVEPQALVPALAVVVAGRLIARVVGSRSS
ncbi:MAG: amino acid permease [Planctomycetes bacterium]|nr:amino acid permease [Planctomycetota bacterium]